MSSRFVGHLFAREGAEKEREQVEEREEKVCRKYTYSNILLEVTDPAVPEVCRTDMMGFERTEGKEGKERR